MIPAARWLWSYDPMWLRGDVAVGVTLAAYLLPAALGDASLAGLPSDVGFYACLFGGLVFWLFCSSRQTSITSMRRVRTGLCMVAIDAALVALTIALGS